MVDAKRDLDSTSHSHIHRALQQAKLDSCGEEPKDEPGCAIKNVELGSLDALIRNSNSIHKVLSSSRYVGKVTPCKEIPRPKILRKDPISLSSTLRWMKRSNKLKNGVDVVASVDDIELEPSVVSPFIRKKPSQSIHGRKSTSMKQTEILYNEKRPDIRNKHCSKLLFPLIDNLNPKISPPRKNESFKRISITLPSIFASDKPEQESSVTSTSFSPFQEDEKLQTVLSEILQNSEKSVNPEKSLKLSSIFRFFSQRNLTAENETMTAFKNKPAQRAIERYYDQRQEFEDRAKLLVIHVPSPHDSLESQNMRYRSAPKLFLRYEPLSVFFLFLSVLLLRL